MTPPEDICKRIGPLTERLARLEALVETYERNDKAALTAAFAAHNSEHTLMADHAKRDREAMHHRLEGMNEIRSQLDRQASTFATKEVVDQSLRELDRRLGDRIALLTGAMQRSEGSANTAKYIVGLGLSFVGVGLVVLGLVLR